MNYISFRKGKNHDRDTEEINFYTHTKTIGRMVSGIYIFVSKRNYNFFITSGLFYILK
jgi:hypothetical protein